MASYASCTVSSSVCLLPARLLLEIVPNSQGGHQDCNDGISASPRRRSSATENLSGHRGNTV